MRMNQMLAGLLTGVLFGIGLAVSQMTNPEKVLSFLTLVKGWDPSLLLVMGAAVPVTFIGYRLVSSSKPLFDTKHYLPTNRAITKQLLTGGAIFGVGWGLAGYCPGPAIAGLTSGLAEPAIFLVAMIAGSQVARVAAARTG